MCQTAFTVMPSPHVLPTVFPINSSSESIVEFSSHPIRNRNCANVASLADQINNDPMLFALLEVIQSQRHGFMPTTILFRATRFRTIPINEFIDGVMITLWGVQTDGAIQNCGFDVLEVWQAQDRFCGDAFLREWVFAS
jgi:hypothetical protein